MSAPAAASATAAALPMPRRQPVTSAVRPERSNAVTRVHARQSTRIFIAGRPCAQLLEHLGHALERLDGGDQPLERERPAASSSIAALVVLRLVDARAAEL